MPTQKVIFDCEQVTEMSFQKLKKLKKLSIQRLADFKARDRSVNRALKGRSSHFGSQKFKINISSHNRFGEDTLELPRSKTDKFSSKLKTSDNIAILISQLKKELNILDSSENRIFMKLFYREEFF